MLDMFHNGYNEVKSPDHLVKITRHMEEICGRFVQVVKVFHYETLILILYKCDCARHISKSGWSFNIGEYAYSPTDARIINQLLERYAPEYTAHSRKGEVIVD